MVGDSQLGLTIPGLSFWGVVGTVSGLVSGYHGYHRNNGSVGWGVGWFVLGYVFPIITPAVAFWEGYGKPKK
jgi:hypothetical protein